MCRIDSPLALSARRLADAQFALERLVCDAEPEDVQEAVRLLKQRGDTRAAALLSVCQDRQEGRRLSKAMARQLRHMG